MWKYLVVLIGVAMFFSPRALGQVNESYKLLPSDNVAGDYFGNAVSISGDVAVIGAYGDDDKGNKDAGSAYVFRWNGTSWVQEQKLLPSDGGEFNLFGNSVSVSGNVAVVGTYTSSGSAYVFRRNGPSWVEEQKFPPLAVNDSAIVFAFGDVIVIGAPRNDSGSASMFRWNGTLWIQQKLTVSDGAAGDYFGNAVSVSGDVAVIGAYSDDDHGDNSGSAYVFRWNGTSWVQEQKLLASDGAAYDQFGASVSVSGDLAVVGAIGDDDSGSTSGSAYVFRWNGSSWVQEQKLLASDGAADDWFSFSVSVSSGVAVVGASGDDDNGFSSGSAYVFCWNGASWVERKKLLPSAGMAGDKFGFSVSVSGDVAIVGAALSNANDSGSAYIFIRLCDSDGDGVCDSDDVCPFTPPGVVVDAQGRPLGDLDGDCDTDLADFQLFQRWFTGSIVPNVCLIGDLDSDSDIDLADFQLFRRGFTGPS